MWASVLFSHWALRKTWKALPWRLHQFLHHGKHASESICEIGLVPGSYLTRPYIGNAFTLGIYPTIEGHRRSIHSSAIFSIASDQCWAVLRMRNRYPWVTNSRIDKLTRRFSNYSKNQFQHISVVFRLWKSQRICQRTISSLLVLSWKPLDFGGEPEQPILRFWFFEGEKRTIGSLFCGIF